MGLLEQHDVACPWCWATTTLALDLSAGDQAYTEDCAVCCQPLAVRLIVTGDGAYTVDVEREND